MEHRIHGSRWDDVLRVMHEPFDEAEARAAYERGEPVAVAGARHPLTSADDGTGSRESRHPAQWALDAALSRGHLRVRFYNACGVLETEHTYERQADGRLLLTESAAYEYTDPTDPAAQWSRVTEVRVAADARSRTVVRQALSDGSMGIRMVEDEGVDLADRWSRVPEFGRWDELLGRELPRACSPT